MYFKKKIKNKINKKINITKRCEINLNAFFLKFRQIIYKFCSI